MVVRHMGNRVRTVKTATDAALDRWRTYQAAQANVRRLAGLLAKENQS